MADETTVHIGENSPEYVAYLLLMDVARNEGQLISLAGSTVPKDYILDTYAECLATVRNPALKWKV
jgi:hypothetical protein